MNAIQLMRNRIESRHLLSVPLANQRCKLKSSLIKRILVDACYMQLSVLAVAKQYTLHNGIFVMTLSIISADDSSSDMYFIAFRLSVNFLYRNSG